jgi:hypothetical protein
MRKGFLKMRKYLVIYEIYFGGQSLRVYIFIAISLYMRNILFSFLSVGTRFLPVFIMNGHGEVYIFIAICLYMRNILFSFLSVGTRFLPVFIMNGHGDSFLLLAGRRKKGTRRCKKIKTKGSEGPISGLRMMIDTECRLSKFRVRSFSRPE